MPKLSDHIKELPSRRNPPYRPALLIDDPERAELRKKLRSAGNNHPPPHPRRGGCGGQDGEAPWSLIMAIARQTWDEVRHAQLATGVLESYGGQIGEYPDTLAGGGGGAPPPSAGQAADGPRRAAGQGMIQEPTMMLSAVNVSLEGGALTLFKETSELGRGIDEELIQHCFDYNW